MEIVPLTPAEDAEYRREVLGITDDQRLEWEKACLTGEPGTVEMSAGALGLCGPVGTPGECAPNCCKAPSSVEQLAETVAAAVRMSREKAKADAEAFSRKLVISTDDGIPAESVDQPSREAILRELAAEPGGLARMAKAWGIPQSILIQAEEITNGQRQKDYGTALDNHERIARYWNAYLRNRTNEGDLEPEDISFMMILMKVARAQNAITEDTLVDIAGYANVVAKMGPQRAERAARLADEL